MNDKYRDSPPLQMGAPIGGIYNEGGIAKYTGPALARPQEPLIHRVNVLEERLMNNEQGIGQIVSEIRDRLNRIESSLGL